MTILYKCDSCGEVVVFSEAIGIGVGQSGKGFMYKNPLSEVCAVVTLGFEEGSHRTGEHFCLACMWDTLRVMFKEFGPEGVKSVNGIPVNLDVPTVPPESGVPGANPPDNLEDGVSAIADFLGIGGESGQGGGSEG